MPKQELDTNELKYKRYLKKITHFLKNNFFSIVTILAVITFIIEPLSTWDFKYHDADGYMRALRIKNWLINPSFFEQPIYESNYPFGEILHWTRPIDIIWVLLTLPFINFMELKEAIFLGGAFLSPILGAFGALSLGYGLKRQFNIFISILGVFLFINTPFVQSIYCFSSADHHSLITTLSIFSTSCIMCWLKKRQNHYLVRLSLALSIMSLCVIDGILFTFITILFFIYLYIFKNISITYAYKIVKNYTIFCILCLILNPPYEGYLFIDISRLSILYITIFVLATIALYILQHYHIHTKKLKITSLFAAFSIISLITILIFGKSALILPLDDEIKAIFINRIMQNKPIFHMPLFYIVLHATIPFISLLLNIYMLTKKNHSHQRLLTLNLFIGLPLFLSSLYIIRLETFFPLYSFIPFLCLIDYIYKNSQYHRLNKKEFPKSIYILIIGFLFLQLLIQIPMMLYSPTKNANIYDKILSQNIKETSGTLLTDLFLSPYYIYNCDVNTVSTPYHRNTEGIIDAHKILHSNNDADIIPLLLKHQITQILLFENYDNKYYSMDEKNKHKLYYRIIKGERLPPFIQRIPSPDQQVHHYKITPL